MSSALLGFDVLILIAVIFLLLRSFQRSAAPDPRLPALLGADLPGQLARSDARGEALERLLRTELAGLRGESADATVRHGESAAALHAQLRRELTEAHQHLVKSLQAGLEALRRDQQADTGALRSTLEAQLDLLQRGFGAFTAETHKQHTDVREVMHTRLGDLSRQQLEDGERLRSTVQARLDKLNENNTAKLEEMRATVDEKLHATLHTRLNESFGAVTEHLARVHTGLGEMSKLSADVGDLSRIFNNVKSRGGFAEIQLGMLLSQMLAPNQFLRNAKVKPSTGEMVEFAVRLPTPEGEVLLPIDAKFPREAWERLESAYAAASPDLAAAGRAFETAIRVEAKRICDKYIAPPETTNFAIMFLPTEGLYAEVMRRDGLQADIQGNCRVTIAGPSTLSALLNSFQMGFNMLHMQKKGNEVWKTLATTKEEFLKFEKLTGSMQKQVGTVQNTLENLNVRTRAINRSLRDVSLEEGDAHLSLRSDAGALPSAFDGLLATVAAEEESTQPRAS